MDTVTVYNYEGFSVAAGKTINHGTYATMKFITDSGLTPHLDRRIAAPAKSVNGDGQYIDPATNTMIVEARFIEQR